MAFTRLNQAIAALALVALVTLWAPRRGATEDFAAPQQSATSIESSATQGVSGLERSIYNFEQSNYRYYDEPKVIPLIPLRPLTPEELQQIIDFMQWLFNSWTWQQILDRFDTDRDGKLSGEELRRFMEAVLPCGNAASCALRDALIQKYLRELLCGNRPGCDPSSKQISLDDVTAWIDTWIRFYERRIAHMDCSTGTTEAQQACQKLKDQLQKLLESLKKLRDTLKPPPPPTTPTAGTSKTPRASNESETIPGWIIPQ